jgi:hypothetical protein
MRLLTELGTLRKVRRSVGAIAQLGERLHGMQEVGGSIPPSSTKTSKNRPLSPSSRGLGLRPFTAATGVRITLGTPYKSKRPALCGSFGFDRRQAIGYNPGSNRGQRSAQSKILTTSPENALSTPDELKAVAAK